MGNKDWKRNQFSGGQGNQGGQPNNQGNQGSPETTVEEKPKEQPNPPAPVQDETEKQIQNAIAWLGRQIVSVREWPSKRDNGRMYATAKTTGKAPNAEYNNPAELASELLDAFRNENTFITYRLRYNGGQKVARLISANKETGDLTFAIEPEYQANASGPSFEHFQKRESTADDGTTAQPVAQAENVGFGRLF